MSKRRAIRPSEDSTDINISPMIDMVFILLIFFIVTTVFVDERGLDVEKPRPNPNQQQNEDKEGPVKITITKSGDLVYKNEKISLSNIHQRVSERVREDPETPVIIECDPSVRSSLMILVMDEAKLGKAQKISVNTKVSE